MCELFREPKSCRNYVQEVKNLLEGIHTSRFVQDFLGRLALVVDECELWIQAQPEIKNSIGLGPTAPAPDSGGYPNFGQKDLLFNALMSAVALDRILWALDVRGSTPSEEQWVHPSSRGITDWERQDATKDDLYSFVISLGSTGGYNIQNFPDKLAAANASTVSKSANYQSRADLNLYMANIYTLVSNLLSLSVVCLIFRSSNITR